jgi:hypothetical protein
MPYKFNPFTGTFDDSTTGPQGATGTVSAAGSGTAATPGIAFSADPNTGIYNPSADNLAISTGGTGRLFVGADGKVAVGNSAITVADGAMIGAASSTGARLKLCDSDLGVTATDGFELFVADGGDAYIWQRENNPLLIGTNGTERMRLTSAGRVGIGTSSPSQVLTAVGNIKIAGAQAGNIANLCLTRTDRSWTINNETDLRFRTGAGDTDSPATATVVFTGAGNVGIGTTSPTELLSLSGGTPVISLSNPSAGATNYLGTAASGDFDLNTGNAGDSIVFKIVNSERARIDSSGRVGIGTSAPSNSLHIAAAANHGIRIERSGAVNPGSVSLTVTSNGAGSFTADADVNLISAASSPIVFTQGSTERARVDSSGNFGVGVTSPATASFGNVIRNKAPSGTGAAGYFTEGANSDTWFGIYSGTGTSDSAALLYPSTGSLRIATTTGVGVGGFSERLRVDSSGRLLVGTSTARTNFFNTSSAISGLLQIEGTSSLTRIVSQIHNANSNEGPILVLGKSRGTTAGSNTVVSSGDILGQLSFQGSDGTEFVEAASVVAVVDGTPGANDMPGRLVFSTTADGAASSTERMRITSAGYVAIGTSSATELLNVNGHSFTGTAEYYTANRTRTSGVTWYKKRGVARPSAGQKGRATITFSESSGSPNAFHKVRVTQSGNLTAAFYEFLVAEAGGTFSIVNDNTAYNKAQFAITMSSPTLTVDTAVVGADWGSMTVEVETFEMGNNDVTLAMSVV